MNKRQRKKPAKNQAMKTGAYIPRVDLLKSDNNPDGAIRSNAFRTPSAFAAKLNSSFPKFITSFTPNAIPNAAPSFRLCLSTYPDSIQPC